MVQLQLQLEHKARNHIVSLLAVEEVVCLKKNVKVEIRLFYLSKSINWHHQQWETFSRELVNISKIDQKEQIYMLTVRQDRDAE